MRVGIYGGSFNPIHIGHLTVMDDAIKDLELEQLVVVPAGNPYMKSQDDMASKYDRFNMVANAVVNMPRVSVCEYEVNKDKPSYTSETLKWFRDRYPENTEFYLILGYDSFLQLAKWHNPKEIMSKTNLWVYNRAAITENTEFEDVHQLIIKTSCQYKIFVPAAQIRISATDIRMRIQEGNSWEYLVPQSVADYIKSKGLYGYGKQQDEI